MDKIPIFIVNLKKDSERKKHMQQLCKQHSLDYQFIDAICGKDLDDNELKKIYDKKRTLSELGRELSAGEIGCTLSHKEIYRTMIRKNIEQAVIFEDDITFNHRIHDAISTIADFPDDWECVLLHYHRNNPFAKFYCISPYNRITVGKNLKIVRFTDLMHSTGAYIINLAGARKLLSALEQGVYKPADHYTGDENEINLYGLHPRLVETDTMIHLQSEILIGRNIARRNAPGLAGKSKKTKSKMDIFRQLLKKIGLHELFRKINLKRAEIAYFLKNIKHCLIKPKKYT